LIVKEGITDFAGYARHDYTIRLSLPEVAAILATVGAAPVDDCPEVLATALSRSLRELIRIAGVCVWPTRALPQTTSEGM
jgi:hypothetical protein